jgi:flavodoxin
MIMSKTLVVYYSRSGKTKMAAKELAKGLDCDVENLVDNKSRKGILGYILAGRDAVTKRTTSIQPVKYDPSKYDMVVLCTPTWASNMAPAIRTYIEKYKDNLKRIAFLVTQGGGCNGKVYENLETATGQKAVEKLDLSGKEFKEDGWKKKLKTFGKAVVK